MSYDLIFWRGSPRATPAETWKRLAAGEPVDRIEPLVMDEVVGAFERAFGHPLELESGELNGPGFTAALPDDRSYLHVTCNWQLLQSADGQRVLATIRLGGCDELGAHCFNPQTSGYRRAPKRLPIADLAAGSERVEMRIEHGDGERWGRVVKQAFMKPVRALAITSYCDADETSEAAVQEIAEAPNLGRLRVLEINNYSTDSMFPVAVGDLSRILERAPQLSLLAVNATTMAMRAVEHAHLRELALQSPNIPFEGLAGSRFTNLQELALRGGTADRPGAILPNVIRAALQWPIRILRLSRVANPFEVASAIERPLFRLDLDPVDEITAAALLNHDHENVSLNRITCNPALLESLIDRFGEANLDHPILTERRAVRRAIAAVPKPKPVTPPPIAVGDVVTHAKFGDGAIVGITDDKLTIQFADSERTLLAKFVTRKPSS